jgi:hypothetical protein
MEKDEIGLLKRASKLQEHESPSAWQASFSSSDKDEGLTEEERREIVASIDEVASRTGISRGAGRSRAVPLKKGFVFPLVVNALALVFTAAVLLGLALIFRRQDQSIAAGNAVVTTAEGKLIREIKRESDSKLQEKDKAIAEIQGRLSSIDRQRNELAASIEQRINARETELRAALQAELDRERALLAERGLSESDIQERIKKIEAQKTAELNRKLDEFRQKVEAEKAAEEARLALVRDEYRKNISDLNEERKKILDEAKKNEERLRASLDARAKELEGQSAAAKASLAKAQSDLSRLEEQRGRTQAAEDRILGLYGSIRVALRERRFEDSLSSIAALKSYLDEPSLLSVANLQARREADIFIAEALGSLARTELERAKVDVSKLLGQAELLAAARAASTAGTKALKAGDLATAAAKYRESLAAVPEILAAHDYFIAGARKGMEMDFAARAAAYEKTIADLRSDAGRSASSLQDESASLKAALQGAKDAQASTGKSLAESERGRAESEKALAEAERNLEASKAEVERLQKRLEAAMALSAEASAKSGAVSGETAAAAAASASDARALAELRARANALSEEYASYLKTEKAAAGATGDFAIVDRQKRLIGFLGGKEVKTLFPELGTLVDSQISSYRQQISLETLRTAADIAIQAATAKTAGEKRAALDANARHYADDPTISDFISTLRELLK